MVSLQATSNEIAAVKNYEGCWVTKLVNVSSTFFVKLRADSYFLGLLTLRRYYNSLFREYGERKHDTTMCFFFSDLGYRPYDFNSRKVAYITGGSAFTS